MLIDKMMKLLIQLFVLIFCASVVTAQQKDTVTARGNAVAITDTVKKSKADTPKIIQPHNPKIATKRSAMIPGWGQAYNKKYWKIPIVWGALGTCVGFFIYNRNEYVAARDAFRLFSDNDPSNDIQAKPKFRPLASDPSGIIQYRNAVRQNVDYSVLAFLVCWGLNVVDATVDGHLKEFNVNENLSMRVNPTYIPQTRQTGINIVMRLGK